MISDLSFRNIRPVAAVWLVLVQAMMALPAFADCDATPKSAVSFSKSIEPIFHTTCAVQGCHVFINPPEELILVEAHSYQYLVNVQSIERPGMKLINPGNPETSYLIHKLRGTHIEAGGVGERMPFQLDPLSNDQISMIATWIKDCSPKN